MNYETLTEIENSNEIIFELYFALNMNSVYIISFSFLMSAYY